jgi:cholesterol transport system auxiliary component
VTSRLFAIQRRRAAFGLCVVVAALAGCAANNRQTFDLSGQPTHSSRARALRQGGALIVRTPEAVAPTGGDRVVVRAADGAVAVLPDAQWSDSLPNLLRHRLVDALQNAGVAAGDTGASPYALLTDVHRFEIDAGRNVAVVDVAVRIVDTTSGAAKAGETFVVETPAPDHYGAPAIVALSNAAAQASARIASWARSRL